MRAENNADRLCQAILALPKTPGRSLIAIAGPPAVGKTTLTELVREKLERSGVPTGVVPMDGFHFDNDHLTTMGLLDRKGSPATFDLPGFQALLTRLGTESTVSVPLFDRARDRTVPEAGTIHAHHQCVLVEGNYLLLDHEGWRDLAPLWTLAVFVQESADELERRLMQRWINHGLSMTEAKRKASINDLPNVQTVLSNQMPSDLVLAG